jgi:hypothetical protein
MSGRATGWQGNLKTPRYELQQNNKIYTNVTATKKKNTDIVVIKQGNTVLLKTTSGVLKNIVTKLKLIPPCAPQTTVETSMAQQYGAN